MPSIVPLLPKTTPTHWFILSWVFAACSVADAPECVTSEMHACSDVEIAHYCNNLHAPQGLRVDFVGGELPAYESLVRIDNIETRFTCDAESALVAAGSVWSCGPDGFFISGNGDLVEIELTTADQTFVESYKPCWDATEPNGDCCGWNFQATVELSVE